MIHTRRNEPKCCLIREKVSAFSLFYCRLLEVYGCVTLGLAACSVDL